MKKIILLVFVISLGFSFRVKSDGFSTEPDATVGLCYTESWQAVEYFILTERETTAGSIEYGYKRSEQPRTDTDLSDDQKRFDFYPVRWHVTGSVSFR